MDDLPQSAGRTARTGFYPLPDGKALCYSIIDPENGTPAYTVLTVPGLGEPIAKKDFELGPALAAEQARHIIYDLRGQGRSSRFLDGDLKYRAYVPAFDIYIDDLQYFFEEIVRKNQLGKVIVNGHSTGGLILLSWLAKHKPTGIAAAIVTAPALALTIPPQNLFGKLTSVPLGAAFTIIASYVFRGLGKNYAWGEHDYAPKFDDRRQTHDPENFNWLPRYFKQHAEETTGGATWRWLYEALKQGYKLRLSGDLKNIDTPTLVLLGGEDHVVPTRKIAEWMRAIPDVEIEIIQGAYHELTNEADQFKRPAMERFVNFIRKYAL